MNVLIYGGGAVGLGIASCLIKSGAVVDIIARQNTVSYLNKSGLLRTGIFGSFNAPHTAFNAYLTIEELPITTYNHILVCTKSFDSEQAAMDLSSHKHLFADNTTIVLFQNGWGNAEIFLKFFDKKRIYNARVITGFTRIQPNHVEITVHADAIHIGSLFGCDIKRVAELCELISHGDIPSHTTDRIDKDLWAKMLYNCALNPLGAILDVPYGVLAKYQPTRTIMQGIVQEAFAAMTAAGYQTHWVSPQEFLKAFYSKLVPDTASHKSSTLQDIAAGKKTEIDALNGAIITLARQNNISVPYNAVVYEIIKFLESRNITAPHPT